MDELINISYWLSTGGITLKKMMDEYLTQFDAKEDIEKMPSFKHYLNNLNFHHDYTTDENNYIFKEVLSSFGSDIPG